MSNIIRSPLITKFEKNLSSKLILTRHGESIYNKKIREINSLKLKNHEEFTKLRMETRVSPDYCDCDITEHGQEECYNTGKKLESINLKYIFVSPMMRALQSCENVVKGYLDANKINDSNKSPKVMVSPLIFEKIEDGCDILSNIYRNMSAYNDYDWTEFKKLRQETLPIYMLNYCDTIIDVKTKEKKFSNDNPYFNLCLSQFKKNLKFNHEDLILRAMEELGETYIESSIKTYDRLIEFKTFLSRFLKENTLKKDERILLVGHSIVFKHFFTKMIYEDTFEPVEKEENYIHLNNGETASVYFDDEVLFKNLRI